LCSPIAIHSELCDPTKKAEPPPTRDVNRNSGTDSANGGWLRRLVRLHHGERINLTDVPTNEDYETALNEIAAEMNVSKGKIILPLRLAETGVSGGPGIVDILHIIGKEKIIIRIEKIIEKLG